MDAKDNNENTKDINQNLPKKEQEKLENLKGKLDSFKNKVLEKFQDYVLGIALMPPDVDKNNKPKTKKINILTLIDDTNKKKMTTEELSNKITGIITSIAKEIDPTIAPEVILLTELWQEAYDAKYDNLARIAMSATIYDKGMMGAIKIAEIHKTMILKKFEKYIVAYVLGGSLVQGKATKESDVDVFVVIDDTDVKRMSRYELKNKLRAIILGMGFEAGEATGIRNKLNIQVYILTDFWDSIREANPVIFTFLRDGIPFYDRGIFMPWKQLLKMGKIKPSKEAIDMFMTSGEQILSKIDSKLNDIAIEDLFYAILTPSQAALMLYGLPPPTPRETPEIMREIFVKKEKLLEAEYVDILENNIKVRKDIEHKTKLKVDGKELDTLQKNAKKYLDRIQKLFKEIEERRTKELAKDAFETTTSLAKKLILENKPRAKIEGNADIEKYFEELKKQTIITDKDLDDLKEIIKLNNQKKKKIFEYETLKQKSEQLIKSLKSQTEMIEAKSIENKRTQFKTESGNIGEFYILDKQVFIFKNIKEPANIIKADIKDG
ncbi:MAG: hypothetical protein GWP09_02270, partial [Nitrospiraceae bacterium]|nr:hypothetical protein [Nitrospiraceae bacterium]